VYSIKESESLVKALQRAIAELLVERLLEGVVSLVVNAAFSILSFVDRIVLLKDIDIKAARSPQRLERQERLLPDASNFVQFLFTLTGGRVPRELEEAARYSFPGVSECRLGLDVTADGRVFIRLVADGVTLPLATIPAGVLKTLIVETALYSKPAVIVIDEFENSLHPELQQFLIDELRNSRTYVFIMSHSTVPLDYVKSPQEVVVLRLEGGETRAYRLREEAREEELAERETVFLHPLSGLLEPAG
jgi:predicted ATPase